MKARPAAAARASPIVTDDTTYRSAELAILRDGVDALRRDEEAGDAFATAHALTDLWVSHSIRRDHGAALDYIDRARHVLGDDPSYADLRSFATPGAAAGANSAHQLGIENSNA
jgi:hypothetical protein